MSKRSVFTTISPLPEGISREAALSFLHDHEAMIDLNPLIIKRNLIPPPPHALEEELRCAWYEITDRIPYLPGEVVYTAAFNDLPNGVQTHCHAAMGTDIRERWTLGGSLPGEPPEPIELGLGAPREGLYLREDVDLRCNFVMTTFVKKTLKKAHASVMDRICKKAAVVSTSSKSSHSSNLNNNNHCRFSTASDGTSSSNSASHSNITPPPPLMNNYSHQSYNNNQNYGGYYDGKMVTDGHGNGEYQTHPYYHHQASNSIGDGTYHHPSQQQQQHQYYDGSHTTPSGPAELQ
ncbi:hypothetical protein F5Y16DRAFT_81099 [Xylariaceae sp. FL0255]|nr:hypothetical protein F5Y16DRAFT_81099 [Xylariaceae sp. FL0255]